MACQTLFMTSMILVVTYFVAVNRSRYQSLHRSNGHVEIYEREITLITNQYFQSATPIKILPLIFRQWIWPNHCKGESYGVLLHTPLDCWNLTAQTNGCSNWLAKMAVTEQSPLEINLPVKIYVNGVKTIVHKAAFLFLWVSLASPWWCMAAEDLHVRMMTSMQQTWPPF